MASVTGAPAELAAVRDELTPMMEQYFELCARYDDCLLLFHVGDFYKTFCDAAETVARLCELTLVTREDSTGEYPMAGIPVEKAESYVERLLEAGYRVAVAEQVEDPEEVDGVADRQVTRVITPGTLTEDALLGGADNNFVACLARDGEYGLALLDVSTGDFYATGGGGRAIRDEIGRFEPAEAIAGPRVDAELLDRSIERSTFDEAAFDLDTARARVESYFPGTALASDAEVRACGALLAYAEYARGAGGELDYLNRLTRYDPREYMTLDPVALAGLELFERRSVQGDGVALVDVLDGTASALGSRKLRGWLRRPLLDPGRIEARLDAVGEWVGEPATRERVHDLLREVYDLERLISRVSRGRADARDLRALLSTLEVVPDLHEAMAGVGSAKLASLRDGLDPLSDVRDLVGRAIRDDPPREITEGDVIRPGYSGELDELRETERAGKEWIESLEAAERERTGIDSLKVGYNSVHGYYIEVTKPNLDRVPDDYVRRQTLKNAERFYTPELKEREDEILRAEGRADDLELELFREVREGVAAETERVQALARALAGIDALAALAEVAANHDYARPEIGGGAIEIERGRHPVVERTQGSFVPNDTRLDAEERLAVITGPNMSGKSTYMRQVALIAVLAQAGSFVPAASARIGVVDRVFTRVGASDDIAGGRSTFMVEMTELAEILDAATERSLVLLDEVGRGTSTVDGLAIARAVTEFVHDDLRARTLFATHHHELAEEAADLDGVVALHFDARRDEDGIAFDHEIGPGTSSSSYGVDVAELAGVPDRVVERARELIDDGGDGTDAERGTAESADPPIEGDPEGGPGVEAIARELREADLADTTPLEALNLLHRLKRRVE